MLHTLYLLFPFSQVIYARADPPLSICITRVIQIIDTSQLDFDDITWSNVDVAIWNMVEVHIGCVTANIPLMAPLFSRLGNIVPRLRSWRGNRLSHDCDKWSSASSSKYTLKNHVGIEHDDRLGMELAGRTMTPRIEKGKTNSADDIEMARLGGQGILVRNSLEQRSYPKQLAS